MFVIYSFYYYQNCKIQKPTMNFFKKIFFGAGKQQPKVQSKETDQKQSEDQVPEEVLDEIFERSIKYIRQSSKTITDEDKLIIYGLYKQATVGDCNTPKPSMLDFIGKSKWNAWNSKKGMPKKQAKKMYVSKAVEIDPEIQKKMQSFFQTGQQQTHQQKPKGQSTAAQSITALKTVEQKDYSDTYSHPYFRLIEKNLPIQKQAITRQFLTQKNNNPKCYSLHFAIDKQRVDLVRQFLEILTVEEINQMQDEDGTGIEEYAELIENEDIIQLVKEKLGK